MVLLLQLCAICLKEEITLTNLLRHKCLRVCDRKKRTVYFGLETLVYRSS